MESGEMVERHTKVTEIVGKIDTSPGGLRSGLRSADNEYEYDEMSNRI